MRPFTVWSFRPWDGMLAGMILIVAILSAVTYHELSSLRKQVQHIATAELIRKYPVIPSSELSWASDCEWQQAIKEVK